jgi:glyoxylase-like metal-dependent hydrolase (beta-lactamase superfamily II)
MKPHIPMVATLLAAALGTLLPAARTAQAAEPAPATAKLAQSQAGYYRLKIGAVDVIALSDGTIGLDTRLLHAPHRHALDAALKHAHVSSPLDTSVNAYLVLLGDRRILVDAGTGMLYGPNLNKLPASLRAVGVEPAQVTDVLVTHVHTDHTGGLVENGQRVYPQARIHVEQRELDHWLNPANEQRAPADGKVYFQQARAALQPYVDAGQVQPFSGAQQLFPGLRSVPAPGHTPGHSFYLLESQGQQLAFWGDVLHAAEVQLPDPTITIAFDVDPAAARAQRLAAFADAARRGYLVAPAHMSFPGIGRLRQEGRQYRWIPLPYVNDAVK